MKRFLSKRVQRILTPIQMQEYSLIFVEIIVGMFVSISSFIYFITFTEDVLAKQKLFTDTVISQSIYSLRTPELTSVMQFLSFLGGEFILFASVVITVALLLKGCKREAGLFSFAILFGFFLNNIIKYLLKVPRPTIDPLVIESFYSFPSGHAMSSFIFYGILAYLVFHFTRKKRISLIATLLSLTIIFLIGLSRVYLGVHYRSDVLAGFVAGFWWLVTVILVDKTVFFYQGFKSVSKR